jgi:hypothetical protein
MAMAHHRTLTVYGTAPRLVSSPGTGLPTGPIVSRAWRHARAVAEQGHSFQHDPHPGRTAPKVGRLLNSAIRAAAVSGSRTQHSSPHRAATHAIQVTVLDKRTTERWTIDRTFFHLGCGLRYLVHCSDLPTQRGHGVSESPTLGGRKSLPNRFRSSCDSFGKDIANDQEVTRPRGAYATSFTFCIHGRGASVALYMRLSASITVSVMSIPGVTIIGISAPGCIILRWTFCGL